MDKTGLVVALGSDAMGAGSPELGRILIKSYLYTLTELDEAPTHLLFFNSGAQLCAEGGNCLDDLKALEAKGCTLLVCGTCADYYDIRDKLAVGRISNMQTIAGTMARAAQLINL